MICPLGRGQTAYATRSARPPRASNPSFWSQFETEWHIFCAFPVLVTHTLVPQLVPILPVLALQILVLEEVLVWISIQKQSELILIIFNEVDIQPISIRAAPHTSHVKDEH